LSCIRGVDEKFEGLFDGGVTEVDEQAESGGDDGGFMRNFGWIYQTNQVATHQRITLDQAWDLPYLEYLNSVAYLKAKGDFEKAQHDKMARKYKTH
jgi:hypothetical protein